MNMVEIERALRQLRLSGIAETLSTRVMQAQVAQEPFLQTFAAMLQDELDRRRSRLTERRYKRSGLDEKVSLADFDWRFNPKLPRAACFELHTLKFIAEGSNALIVGKPGTGKSHIAKAIAYQATLGGHDVRYLEADAEFARDAVAAECNPNVETVIIHDLDFEQLRRHKESGNVQNWHDRRRDLYRVLYYEDGAATEI